MSKCQCFQSMELTVWKSLLFAIQSNTMISNSFERKCLTLCELLYTCTNHTNQSNQMLIQMTNEQQSIPVRCIPPAYLVPMAVCPTPTPTGCRCPLDADHFWMQTPWRQTLLDAGHVVCDACWEANLPLWTDKHLWQHYLALNFVCGQ